MDTILRRFAIKSLYGERDVEIDFSNNIKIIVAENGYGKTTVLNTLYFVLSGNLSKLKKIDFETIEIEFLDKKTFIIKRDDIHLFTNSLKEHPFYYHFSKKAGESVSNELLDIALTSSKLEFENSYIVKSISKKIDIPIHQIYHMFQNITESVPYNISSFKKKNSKVKKEQLKVQHTLEQIQSKFPYDMVYLPTYRRVEQDFKVLSINNEIEFFDGHSINFGMSDIDKRFKEIIEEITVLSATSFSKISGQMLSQLIRGFTINPELLDSVRDSETVNIVLNRCGNNIEESDKREIIKLVESGAIFKDHDSLIYLIANLVKVYEQQRVNDQAIQDFSEVCNKYLVDKEICYNKSNVTIDVVRRKNSNPVDLEHLSSGEKQIISLFARLYLKQEDKLAIFFDEPELSLSIEWQKTLLPDIIKSGKCAFLFTTTHSPFIFENDLRGNAVDLGIYIKEL